MTAAEMRAKIDAAYAIALASDAALRALVILVGAEKTKMIWELGYVHGTKDAYDRAMEIYRDLTA